MRYTLAGGVAVRQRETLRVYLRRVARMGGKARAKTLTPERLSEIGKEGASVRWAKARARAEKRAARAAARLAAKQIA